MVEKIKKNWKVISIVIIAILLLRGCISSCNHDNMMNKVNTENTELKKEIDSINKYNKILNDSVKYLNIELTGERDKGNAISDAHNLGNDYYQYTINNLNDSIKKLNDKIINLNKTIHKKR